ncbi:MAG: tetratricopeptide repeat protein [Candidatus Aminicenantes bacterium]|nr:tetratricopeptide repeat protein [Candidatus Aminicenantes bacterium]
MKKYLIFFAIILFLTLTFCLSQSTGNAAVDKNKKSVISFTTYDDSKKPVSSGTGFIVGEEICMTNYHLVADVNKAEGRDFKGDKVKIEGIIHADKQKNIAYVKVKSKADPLQFAGVSSMPVGEKVYAIGSNEVGQIISTEGTIEKTARLESGLTIFDVSVSVTSQFSGAPLMDKNGKVIGIFVIPGSHSKFVLGLESFRTFPKGVKETDFDDWQAENYVEGFEGASFIGKAFAAIKETGTAELYLNKAIKHTPDSVDLLKLLADVYQEQRNYEAASNTYKKLMDLDPQDYEPVFERGVILVKLRKFKDGINLLEQAVKMNPEKKTAYAFIGNAYQELEEWSNAAQAYGRYLETKPKDKREILLNQGYCYMQIEQYEQAARAFEGARELDPKDEKVYFQLAQAYEKAGQLENAAQTLEIMAKMDPDQAERYYNLIIRLFDVAGQSDKGIPYAEKLVELKPNNESGYYNLGLMYQKVNKYEKAVEAFKKATKIKPDFEMAYTMMGVCYNSMKQYSNSNEAFGQVLKTSPDNVDAWFNIGINYMLMKNYGAALEPMKKTIELKPDFAVAYYNLGIVYLNLNDRSSASHMLQKLNKLDTSLAAKLRSLF